MPKIYEVGGSIRDRYLYGEGYVSKDKDYAVEAGSYEEMLFYVRDELGYQVFLEKPKFGTLRAKNVDGKVCDYTICRKDGFYHDGRHPDHIEPCAIVEDLARRDATCNAIAINVDTGELLDPYGGIEDIQRRKIRAVGNAEERCLEDGLRTLRYLRFCITKKMFLDVDLYSPIFNCHLYLPGVSADRIRDELTSMFRVDTARSFILLGGLLSQESIDYIFKERGVWLLPTTKEK